jgi:hypothetical protein
MRNAHKIFVRKYEGKIPLGRRRCRWKADVGRVWTRFTWYSWGRVGGFCECGNENSGFLKCGIIVQIRGYILCSMEFELANHAEVFILSWSLWMPVIA